MKTLDEIAQLASVSRATVSRVINAHPHVSAEVRQRVLDVIEQYGYVPNASARAMVTKRTKIIGLLMPDYAEDWSGVASFYPLLIHSVSSTCARHDHYLLLSIMPSDTSNGFFHDILRAGHVDGVLVAGLPKDHPYVKYLLDSQLPSVLIGHHPYLPDFHSVDVDNFQSAVTAVSYLIERGRRHIGLIPLASQDMACTHRHNGYHRALLQHGLPIQPELVVDIVALHGDGYAAAEQLLALPQKPDAIFACSDGLAIEAMRAVQAHGLRIPEDIAVIGFDDLPSAKHANPPLTTIHQPIVEMGRQAVELLFTIIKGNTAAPQHITLSTSLIKRAST